MTSVTVPTATNPPPTTKWIVFSGMPPNTASGAAPQGGSVGDFANALTLPGRRSEVFGIPIGVDR